MLECASLPGGAVFGLRGLGPTGLGGEDCASIGKESSSARGVREEGVNRAVAGSRERMGFTSIDLVVCGVPSQCGVSVFVECLCFQTTVPLARSFYLRDGSPMIVRL